MRIVARCIALATLFATVSLLFCSFDDETDLGNDIINGVDPDKVNMGRHYKEYVLYGTSLDTCYSMPNVDDKGFGVHDVTGSSTVVNAMVVGRKNNEVATALVKFLCTTDTNRTKGGRLFYGDFDSLVSIKILFSRITKDTTAPDYKMKVFSSMGDEYSFDTNNTPFDTLTFNDSSLIDSVTLPADDLRDSIYRSCRSLDTIYSGDTFGFGLTNISRDTLYCLHSNTPTLKVSVLRKEPGKNDTVVFKAYSVTKAFYIGQEDRRDTLQILPISSYASSRTAVFRYNAADLWKAMEDSASGSVYDLISAIFVLPCPPKDSSQVYVKCMINGEPINDAEKLDSLFNIQPTGTIKDSLWSLSFSVRKDLQLIARSAAQPASLYLFVRLDCNRNNSLSASNKEAWQTVVWDRIPRLKTIIYIP